MDQGAKDKKLTWNLVDSRVDRRYNLFSVSINKNQSPRTGNIHEFQVLNSPDWVAVIPITPDGRMVMVKQYRHGSSEISLEPPGGLVKDGCSPEQSGLEELEEETGYKSDSMELLGWMYPMPALFTNKFWVYLARNVVPTGNKNPDETEEVQTVLMAIPEIRESIRTGNINCAVMIAALHLFLDKELGSLEVTAMNGE
jgi:ADP-ribose pyrophosphatase